MKGAVFTSIHVDAIDDDVTAFAHDGSIIAMFGRSALRFRTAEEARGLVRMLQKAIGDDTIERMRPDDEPAVLPAKDPLEDVGYGRYFVAAILAAIAGPEGWTGEHHF